MENAGSACGSGRMRAKKSNTATPISVETALDTRINQENTSEGSLNP